MSERARRGAANGSPARRGPPRRSGFGLPVFLAVVAVAVVGLAALARPAVADAVVAYVAEHDTLLRQDFVRAIVTPRIGAEVDRAKDPDGATRQFAVARGETVGSVGRRLESEGIVRSALAFDLVLYEAGKEDALQSGTYQVSPALTPRDLATLLLKAPGEQVVLRIIEGWRLTEIAAAVERVFPRISKAQFLAAAVVGSRAGPILAGLDPKTPLEGLLFPDTYFMRPDATADEIVDTLVAQLDRRAGATLSAAATKRKTSVYDLVKLASIVEREARDRAESPRIAGVYQNRLNIGMKLDADPTIQYALGEWRELTLDDLKKSSPYNTYLVAGLPPTPICSPGIAALEAAAAPETHDFLYFVAKNDGTGDHAFARTLEEQEANRLRYGNR